MTSWFRAAFGYGLGAAAGRAIFGDDRPKRPRVEEPVREMTEAEIRADEKRFDEEAKRLAEEDGRSSSRR